MRRDYSVSDIFQDFNLNMYIFRFERNSRNTAHAHVKFAYAARTRTRRFILEPPCWKSRSANDPGCDESPHLVISRIVFAKTWPCFKMSRVSHARKRGNKTRIIHPEWRGVGAFLFRRKCKFLADEIPRRLPRVTTGWIVNGPSIQSERAIFRGKTFPLCFLFRFDGCLPFPNEYPNDRIFWENGIGKREFERDSYPSFTNYHPEW